MATVFKFKADGSQYTRGLNQMRGQTQKFATGIGGMLKGAFAFAGITGIKRLGDEMDRIQKLSKRFALDAEVIQRLGFAAEQGGSSMEIMAKGLAQANRASQEALKGLLTYKRAFQDLNINVEEFSKLDQEKQFMVIADAVRNSTDANKSMAASQVILGRAGLEMYAQLKDGAQGYRDVIEGLKTFTQEQVDAAAKANDTINKTTKSVKVFAADVTAFLITSIKGIRAAGGQLASETGPGIERFARLAKASLFGTTAAAVQLRREFKGTKSELSEGASARIKLAFEEGVFGQELEDMMRERTAKGMAEGIKTAIDITKDLIDAGTPKPEDKDVTKKREQIEGQRKSNLLVGEEDEEALVRIQDEIARGLEEYAEMRKDPFTEQLDLLTKEYELLQLQNKELELIDKAKRKSAAETTKQTETIAKQEGEISAERKRREEIGMSEEQILSRRKSELESAEEAFANLGADADGSGTVDADDDIFRNDAALDIERRKTEIAQLEQSIAEQKEDPQTSIIASSLAAIGGGGGVAAFGTDPILNENKRQSNLLEQLVKLQGGTIEGGGGLEIPEL